MTCRMPGGDIMKNPRRRAINLFLFALLSWPGFAQDPARPEQEPPREAQPDSDTIVPAGTTIPIVLTSFLNTKSSQKGDTFYADTVYPIWIQQRLIIPKGSTIRGTVTEVIRPGRVKGRGRLAIRIDNILLPNGVSRDLVAVFRGLHGPGDEQMDRKTETVEGGSSKGQDAGTVIGMSTQGAILGAIVNRSAAGAGIGAGAGAAVGLAQILLMRGKDLVLQPGTQFDLELKQPLKFVYGEVDFTNAQLESAGRSVTQRPRGTPQRPVSVPRSPGWWPPRLRPF